MRSKTNRHQEKPKHGYCEQVTYFLLYLAPNFCTAGFLIFCSYSNYLTLRPVALKGEGSNCFSITQLVGQKRQ